MEKMYVKVDFYLMVNYRKHFSNEDLRQETEFYVCMKSERALASLDAWHISASSFVYKCYLSQMVVVK